VTIFCTIHYC